MSTLTINKKCSLKEIKEYCQSKGIKPQGNPTHKKSWLKGIESYKEDQKTTFVEEVIETTSIVPIQKEQSNEDLSIKQVLPKTIQFKGLEQQGQLIVLDKTPEINDQNNLKDPLFELVENQRNTLIKRLFQEFGSKYQFKVKIERKHDYSTFSELRLLEHLLWWFLVRGKKMSQSEVGKLWKTDKRLSYSNQLSEDPIIQSYFSQLF